MDSRGRFIYVRSALGDAQSELGCGVSKEGKMELQLDT